MPSPRLCRRLLGSLAALLLLAAAAQAAPVPQPPQVLDGPSADIGSLGGLAVARDGTGGLVYLKQVGGVPHVFLSQLAQGRFQPPAQIDGSLGQASSQPVIAAGRGGVLIVAFINGGSLYVVQRPLSGQPLSAPINIADGAMNPALSLTAFGKAYLAFTAGGAGGHDVRAAYFNLGRWTLESGPLDANPADDAGTGDGRPAVVAAGDGIGIVAWGENGHIDTRRLWAASPSVVFEQADVPSLGGANEISAGQPEIGAGGDSSYAGVVFQEQVAVGGATQSRVIGRRLHSSQYDPAVIQVDGLSTPGGADATQPNIAVGEYGRGFATATRSDTGALTATHLNDNAVFQSPFRVDSLTNQSPADAVPALAGVISTLIAWQQDSGIGAPEIRARYAGDGVTLGPELVLSQPADGPTDAPAGLAAGGDLAGNAAVGWVQGADGSREIVTEQMFQGPGTAAPRSPTTYARQRRPRLTWSAAREQWGPVRYLVRVDGVLVGQTVGTTTLVAPQLPDGRHHWQITAQNLAGLTTTSRTGSFWLDAVPPVVTLKLTGRLRVNTLLHLIITDTDVPALEPPHGASGIATIKLDWGDGTTYTGVHLSAHRYLRSGRYTVTVTVSDKAGNVTRVSRRLVIVNPPKRKPKPKAPRKTTRGPGAAPIR